MPKPTRFSYEKKVAFRDAFLFIIICEGKNREPDYFRFFEGLSSRVTIIPVESGAGSAPSLLMDIGITTEDTLDAHADRDRIWFVIDTDRWRAQLHDIREECARHPHWRVAQSNPCFEVWLYFHAKKGIPALKNIAQCSQWKPFLPTIIQGGFNPDYHPVAIETATINAEESYVGDGYFPAPGSTQIWQLTAELLPLIKRDLDNIRNRFPELIVIG